MSIAAVSLIALLLVIVVCAKKGTNPGILGLFAAFVLGFFIVTDTGVTVSSVAGGCNAIFSGFPMKFFLRFVFIAILFGIAKKNGTMERIVYGMLKLIGGNLKLVPIAMFLILSVLGFFGGGGIPLLMMVMMLTADICKQTGLDYFKTAIPVYTGQALGINSWMSVLGLATQEYAGRYGFDISRSLAWTSLAWSVFVFILFYVIMGCYKFDSHAEIKIDKENSKWTAVHIRTALCLLVFAVMALAGFEVALAGIAIAAVLIYLDGYNEKELVEIVPWNTMIMIAGMGMFIATVQAAGGVTLLSSGLNAVLNEKNAGILFSLIGSILSTIADGGSVITPAMVPVAATLAAENGLNASQLIVSLTLGMCATSLSPVSTGGATVLSCQSGYDGQETKLYTKMFIMAIIYAIVTALWCLAGIFIGA